MNQAEIGPNASPNAPSSNFDAPGQPAASSGTSAFAVLVGAGFLLVTTFFVTSLYAVWKRSEGRTMSPVHVPTSMIDTNEAPRSPVVPDSEVWLNATVNIKRVEKGPGKLRAIPGFNGGEVAEFDHKSPVKVASSSVKNHEKWYRVKGLYKGAMVEGYMHSDIVILAP